MTTVLKGLKVLGLKMLFYLPVLYCAKYNVNCQNEFVLKGTQYLETYFLYYQVLKINFRLTLNKN